MVSSWIWRKSCRKQRVHMTVFLVDASKMHFSLSSQGNIERVKQGKKQEFQDDCGAWTANLDCLSDPVMDEEQNYLRKTGSPAQRRWWTIRDNTSHIPSLHLTGHWDQEAVFLIVAVLVTITWLTRVPPMMAECVQKSSCMNTRVIIQGEWSIGTDRRCMGTRLTKFSTCLECKVWVNSYSISYWILDEVPLIIVHTEEKMQDLKILLQHPCSTDMAVWHKELLFKLCRTGRVSNLWRLFENYLTSCIQCVVVENNIFGLPPLLPVFHKPAFHDQFLYHLHKWPPSLCSISNNIYVCGWHKVGLNYQQNIRLFKDKETIRFPLHGSMNRNGLLMSQNVSLCISSTLHFPHVYAINVPTNFKKVALGFGHYYLHRSLMGAALQLYGCQSLPATGAFASHFRKWIVNFNQWFATKP